MKVRELIKQLLNYNLDADVESRFNTVDAPALVDMGYNRAGDETIRLTLHSETLDVDEKVEQFPKGAWVKITRKKEDAPYSIGRIDYCNDVKCRIWFSDGPYMIILREEFEVKQATFEEVKADLITEATRRGFVAGAKFHPFGRAIQQTVITPPLEFSCCSMGDDYYLYVEALCGNPLIYGKGCWAEVIHNNKPLPTTCEGLAALHDEWSQSDMRGLPFLKFLEQQGYHSE